MSSTFFTSDLHLGHANIIKYCNRPFTNVDQMDQALVEKWNSIVQQDDLVYLLGDVSFHKDRRRTEELLWSLNGTIVLICGNHDRGLQSKRFKESHDLVRVKVRDQSAPGGCQHIVLCHYAMRVWDLKHRGSWHLYGHSHGNLPDDPDSLSLDVGVDCWNYRPVGYDEIAAAMDRKETTHGLTAASARTAIGCGRDGPRGRG